MDANTQKCGSAIGGSAIAKINAINAIKATSSMVPEKMRTMKADEFTKSLEDLNSELTSITDYKNK
jgi:hypothetical protein